MDVNSLGQGRQNAYDFNYNVNSSSTDNVNNSNIDSESNIQNVVQVDNNKSDSNGNLEQNNSQQRQITEKDVKSAADKLNKLLEGNNTHVEYDFVGKSRIMSVKIIDDKTKDVVREIPPKKIIEMIDKLCELAGIMVDEKA